MSRILTPKGWRSLNETTTKRHFRDPHDHEHDLSKVKPLKESQQKSIEHDDASEHYWSLASNHPKGSTQYEQLADRATLHSKWSHYHHVNSSPAHFAEAKRRGVPTNRPSKEEPDTTLPKPKSGKIV